MIKFISDLGMQQRGKSKTKRRYYKVQCTSCKRKFDMQSWQYKARATKFCQSCSLKLTNRSEYD